ncbi:unnamed protein product [Lactuca virosa]|uniref:Uncharacterized protein n=1 Tax=Lactuca virosa TaxID=75947 RepID=A0AAU9N1D7_9ASTR|nr:unnamed protein product [Lactuca virosa]
MGKDDSGSSEVKATALHPAYTVTNVQTKIRTLDGVKIYSTLSDDLMVRILESDTTAQAAWNKLKVNFLNNKGSRAAALEQEFSNLNFAACSSMEAYCQKLKDLVDQLEDVDNPVTESRLVLQMVRGLPPEFDVVGAYINQSSPSWETARSMLQLEQHQQNTRQNQSHTALAVSDDRSQKNPTGDA